MPEKSILVLIKTGPYTTLNSYEALRVAIGLWEHKVTILWTGDGVYSLLKDADQTLTSHFHRDLPDLDIEAYYDEEATASRGLTGNDLVLGLKPASSEKITDLVMSSEVSLVF
jgi:sulfur relay (sulfurtransferase) DsrF/TusC family protein